VVSLTFEVGGRLRPIKRKECPESESVDSGIIFQGVVSRVKQRFLMKWESKYTPVSLDLPTLITSKH